MDQLGPKDRVGHRIIGPKKTRTRLNKIEGPKKMTRPSTQLENGNPNKNIKKCK